MLRDTNVEKGMVYRRGELKGKMKSAKIMIQDFNLSIKEVSEKLDIPINDLLHLVK